VRTLGALIVVTLTGFVSLSYEILWVRLYSFASQGVARAFGALLGSYLLGLALGSLWSMRFRDDRNPHDPRHLKTVALFVLAANLAGFLMAPVVSFSVTLAPWWATLVFVVPAAALLGATLPLLCHFAIAPDSRAGQRLSWLYLGNIVGSFAGSLLTGFVLMDVLTFRGISVVLALVGIAIAVAVLVMADRRGRFLLTWSGASAGLALAVLLLAPVLFDGLWERLLRKTDYDPSERFVTVIESRHGVITVDDEGRIYGGGAYDGRVDTGLAPGSWLVRPYILAAVHPDPEDVLVIGVSGGAWTQILAHHPKVERLTAVEISPAYLDLIAMNPEVESLSRNPKVTIHIDDGRRWLVRHPDARFDAVVINMTFHWRAHSTHVLSREFMELVRRHLKPGGVFLFNATSSKDVARTAIEVFPHGMMVINNVLVSDDPIRFDVERWRGVLEGYAIDGKPVFDLETEAGRADLEGVLSIADTLGRDVDDLFSLRNEEQMRSEVKGARIVTDDNMLCEY
jgi:spermidine synthase